jgi:DNA-directed RNA polymerase subunit omega
VLVAAKRARQLSRGAEATIAEEGDKPTVIALRELAANKIDPKIIMQDEETPPYFG